MGQARAAHLELLCDAPGEHRGDAEHDNGGMTLGCRSRPLLESEGRTNRR